MIKKKNPSKVSVIIPTYNRANFLPRTIESVFAQTYQNLEVIIVDDGSTDSTKMLIMSLKKIREIKYFYQNRLGACVARNKGLELATGDYIQFLDSDDYLSPEKIKIQIDAMEKDNTPCAICDFEYVDVNGNILKSVVNNGNIHSYVANFRSTSIMTPLIKRTNLNSELKWNQNLKRNQDMDFMFKYFMTISRWSYTPGFFCKYVMHEGEQISNTYHQGIQPLMLYKSMQNFIYVYNGNLSKQNKVILRLYRNKLFKFYLRQKIKKIFQMLKLWNLFNWIRSKFYLNI